MERGIGKHCQYLRRKQGHKEEGGLQWSKDQAVKVIKDANMNIGTFWTSQDIFVYAVCFLAKIGFGFSV